MYLVTKDLKLKTEIFFLFSEEKDKPCNIIFPENANYL